MLSEPCVLNWVVGSSVDVAANVPHPTPAGQYCRSSKFTSLPLKNIETIICITCWKIAYGTVLPFPQKISLPCNLHEKLSTLALSSHSGTSFPAPHGATLEGLLGGQVGKALDYRLLGPRFWPHYINRDFFHLGVYSALPPKKCLRRGM